MSHDNSVIAVYVSHEAAEAAIKELQLSGFEMKKLSIIGQDIHTEGLLFGSAIFLVPGLGPLLVAGPLVAWIVGALEGAIVGGGRSIVGAALYNLGIPKDSVVRYEKALKTGRFLLIAHGVKFDTTLAREILDRTGPETLDHHDHGASEVRTCAKP